MQHSHKILSDKLLSFLHSIKDDYDINMDVLCNSLQFAKNEQERLYLIKAFILRNECKLDLEDPVEVVFKKSERHVDYEKDTPYLYLLATIQNLKCCVELDAMKRVPNRRSLQCPKCSKQIYPTNNTILEKTTIPLSNWFKIIYQINNNAKFLIADVQREMNITYKTAWRIYHLVKQSDIYEKMASCKESVYYQQVEPEMAKKIFSPYSDDYFIKIAEICRQRKLRKETIS